MLVGNAAAYFMPQLLNKPTSHAELSPCPPLPTFTTPTFIVAQVHGRTLMAKKTTQGAPNWDIIRKVKDAVSIPVVANGGIETGADAERLLEETGADAVMSSEGLLENPALFDRSIKPMEELEGVEVGRVEWGGSEFGSGWFPGLLGKWG